MFARFRHALVCPPAPTMADGLTTVALGVPDFALAQQQHKAYCDALVRNGCALVELPVNARHPDSTFVEDTALILPGRGAILARPGDLSRQGEVAPIEAALAAFFALETRIEAPGTLDAGDICESESHVFIGVSKRTNSEGATQLGVWLQSHGFTSSVIDIRDTVGILHLKSGVTALRGRQLLAIPSLAHHPDFRDYDVLVVPNGEEYAANCVLVNDAVFVAAGFPGTHASLRDHGYTLEVLDMSEFEKMDGGLSCLSLRF